MVRNFSRDFFTDLRGVSNVEKRSTQYLDFSAKRRSVASYIIRLLMTKITHARVHLTNRATQAQREGKKPAN